MVVQHKVTDSGAPGRVSDGRLQPVKRTYFQDAMSAIASLRDRMGLSPELFDPAKWAESPLFLPVVRGLEWAEKSFFNRMVLVPTTAVVTFVLNPELVRQFREGRGPWVEFLKTTDNAISANPLGSHLLNVAQTVCNYPLLVETNTLISLSNPSLLNVSFLVGGLAQIFVLGYPGVKVLEYLFSRILSNKAEELRKQDRMRRGEEPLPTTVMPKRVLVGGLKPLEIYLEADSLRRGRNSSSGFQVAVCPQSESAGIDRLLATKKVDWCTVIPHHDRVGEDDVVKSSGLDRAREIVVFALDPEKVAFSGDQATGSFSPQDCLILLNKLAYDGAPCLKKLVLVVPRDASLSQYSLFRDFVTAQNESVRKLTRQGVEVQIVHPEDVVIARLRREIDSRSESRQQSDAQRPFSILLAGESNRATLETMARAIERSIRGVSVLVESREDYKTKPSKKSAHIRANRRNRSDLVLIYGSNDTETLALAETIPLSGFAKEKVLALVETPQGGRWLDSTGIGHICTHRALSERLGLSISRS